MTGALVVRPAVPDDAASLAMFKRRTFRETFIEEFGIAYTPDDVAAFEAQGYAEHVIARELADPAHRTWIAVAESGVPVAYCHIGPCKLPHPRVMPGDGEIYQLYVAREGQGAGLGKRLMAIALGWLAECSPERQWLGV